MIRITRSDCRKFYVNKNSMNLRKFFFVTLKDLKDLKSFHVEDKNKNRNKLIKKYFISKTKTDTQYLLDQQFSFI